MRLTQAQLAELETKGIKLIDSRFFDGVHYDVDGVGITIYAGKCGNLQINWDRIDNFIEELMEFQEVYGYETRPSAIYKSAG